MNKTIDFVKTLLAILLAVMLTGCGVALILGANMGSDAINVFVGGLSNSLHISVGNASWLYNIITITIALLLNRKNIGWATILYAILTGYAIDFFMMLFSSYSLGESTWVIRIGCVVFSQVIFTLAFALLIKYRKGMNQLDVIAYEIESKTKWNYKWVRSGIDLILMAIGWLLGGVIGIGTLFAICTTGVMIDFWVKQLDRITAN